MAPTNPPRKDWAIGERADGSINIFPLSELGERVAKRDAEEAAIADAMEQVDGEDLDDISDLDAPTTSARTTMSKRDAPVKVETTQEVRTSLLDLIERFRSFAEEKASSPDASEEDKRFLAQDVEQLCGSEEDVEPPGLPDPGAVMSLVKIIDEYEALRLWLADLWPRLSEEDQAALTLKVGPFRPGGAVDLRSALVSSFGVGVYAQNPIEKLRALRERKVRTAPGRKAKEEKSAERTKLMLQLREEGKSAGEIQGELVKRGFEKGVSLPTIYRKIGEV